MLEIVFEFLKREMSDSHNPSTQPSHERMTPTSADLPSTPTRYRTTLGWLHEARKSISFSICLNSSAGWSVREMTLMATTSPEF